MTAREIIERIAYLRRVEEIVRNVAHVSRLTPALQDLAQMVYDALLAYDDEKIVDLWDSGDMDFFITRIVLNQYRSTDSPWRRTYDHPRGARIISIDEVSGKM